MNFIIFIISFFIILDVISFEAHQRKNDFPRFFNFVSNFNGVPSKLQHRNLHKTFSNTIRDKIYLLRIAYSVNLLTCNLSSLSIVSNRNIHFRSMVFAAVRYYDDLKLVKRSTISTRQNSICYC